jgi:hypothetical protein
MREIYVNIMDLIYFLVNYNNEWTLIFIDYFWGDLNYRNYFLFEKILKIAKM